tara:strand:- start:990 stop:1172 length:183 start_codon:yes stop_codon:yes gene_type:complete
LKQQKKLFFNSQNINNILSSFWYLWLNFKMHINRVCAKQAPKQNNLFKAAWRFLAVDIAS